MTDPSDAFDLGQRVHAALKGHPAFEMTSPDDDAGTVTVYLKYDDADLRRELDDRYGDRMVVEVVGRDGGWRTFLP